MSANAACERKPTRPAVIVPQLRPVSSEACASGSRRIPEPTATKKPAHVSVGDMIESNISNELRSLTEKRNILVELGLEISDDEAPPAAPVVQSKTVLIQPMRGPGFCSFKLVKGDKKGQACGKKSVKGQAFCTAHSSRIKNSTRVSQDNEIKHKLDRLETVVLNLMKDNRVLANKATPTDQTQNTQVEELKSVTAALNGVQGRISQIQKTAERVFQKQDKMKKSNIQKIRIYKLNPFETYLLIRYKNGNPIFQIKSSGRYITVPLPTQMAKPIPNNRWSLVCHPEKPVMIWKEM